MSRDITRTPAEEARALAAALAAGDVVRAACWCDGWLLAACDVGAACGACGAAMVAVRGEGPA